MQAAAVPTPDSAQYQSLNHAAFKDQSFEDPYLSAPSDPEEHSFKTTAIGLKSTSPSSADRGLQSPSNIRPDGGWMGESDHSHLDPDSPRGHTLAPSTSSYQDFLSPYSDLSVHTSPSADGSFFFDAVETSELDNERPSSAIHQRLESISLKERHESLGDVTRSLQDTSITSSHLLSPQLTNNPSPSSDFTNSRSSDKGVETQLTTQESRWTRADTPAHLHGNMSIQTSGPGSDNLSVNTGLESGRSTSPIVKVSTYSRGDSPAGDAAFLRHARPASQPSTHLSPDGDDEYESSDDREDKNSTVSIPPAVRADDGSWIRNPTSGQAGIEPTSREDIYVPSPEQLEEERKLAEKNADIHTWSASVSAANSEAGDDLPPIQTGNRRRARSVGDPSLRGDYFSFEPGKPYFDDSNIPGPGVLIHEDSDWDDGDSVDGSGSIEGRSESPTGDANPTWWVEPTENLSALEPSETENEEPSPGQFFRPLPWRDPPRCPFIQYSKTQPDNSNAAIMKFLQRAKSIDNASRSATWGTRRLSESEVNSIIGSDGSFKNMSISDNKEKKHERRSSLIRLLSKRSSNNLKRKMSDLSQRRSSSDSVDKDNDKDKDRKKDNRPNAKPTHQRKLSIGRPKSSPLNTSSAIMTITGQIAAVGRGGPVRAAPPNPAVIPSSAPSKGCSRIKSEVPKGSNPSLFGLTTYHGGPQVSSATSPLLRPPSEDVVSKGQEEDDDDDEDEDEDDKATDEKGVVMEFPALLQPPIPTLEGFKNQVTQLNPRLHPALVHRFAHEQIRRYRKLVECKANHVRAVSQHKCGAGKHCFAQGGEATLLPPRTSPRDPDATYALFQIPGNEDSDDESSAFGEGAVTAAQFPPGVPMPPVKRLPAEFECILCFKVKKFQKPSDWTKHVHEDVLPFTCTFPQCTEPKSFKRKADWVRHENERHRQLEWWTCNIPDCRHTCYRKDNFVQHLVREHKMPEPKVKKMKGKTSGKSALSLNPGNAETWEQYQHEQDVELVWKLVEECRHGTHKQPKDEPCRFCGNVCSSWKKLTVHLAKHMEQISMPVLDLVKKRQVSADTVISPVEQASTAQYQTSTLAPANPEPASNASLTVPPHSSSIKIEQGTATGVLHVPSHNDSSQNNEGFAVSHVPACPNNLLVPDGLTGYNQANLTNSYDDISHYPQTSSAMAGQAAFQAIQSRYMPVHQNSVTYPPPYNAFPRQRAWNQDNGTLAPASFGLSISTLGLDSLYDPQPQLYASPTADIPCAFQDGVAQEMPYPASGGMGYPAATPGQGNPGTSDGGFIPGTGPTYHFQQQ
ncbi:hypothetical protein VTN00DRAFT_2822 [Thermoascus crustaceus]|uniref:uncharacterized protein n=1 Tax=Thermoascus crustaceus TaxID=5088 RepID=UPI003742C2E7